MSTLEGRVQQLTQQLAALEKKLDNEDLGQSMDIFYLVVMGAVIFFMQAGFALLEAGSVRSVVSKNLLKKNLMIVLVGAIVWWIWGWAFAFGVRDDGGNKFIGLADFFLANFDGSYASWFYHYALAMLAVTIVSGSMAERTKFTTYFVYSIVITGFIFPIVAHWVWSPEGWISSFRATDRLGNGMVDAAGSGVIHMVGGLSGLMGTLFVKERIARWDPHSNNSGNNMIYSVVGTFILWFGWYALTAGSTLKISGGFAQIAGKIVATTTLSGAASGFTCLFLDKFWHGNNTQGPDFSTSKIINGTLAGLVGISAGCAVVDVWGGFVIGLISGVIYYFTSLQIQSSNLDDPLDAISIHGFCGMWGVLAVGFFATEQGMTAALGHPTSNWGLMLGGGAVQLGIQAAGAFAIAGWTMVISGAMFFVLASFGQLRIPEEEELENFDWSKFDRSRRSRDINFAKKMDNI